MTEAIPEHDTAADNAEQIVQRLSNEEINTAIAVEVMGWKSDYAWDFCAGKLAGRLCAATTELSRKVAELGLPHIGVDPMEGRAYCEAVLEAIRVR